MVTRPSIVFVALGSLDSTLAIRARLLAEGLAKLGWQSHVIYPKSESDPAQIENVQTEGLSRHKPLFVAQVVQRLLTIAPHFVHFLNPSPIATIIAGLISRSRTKIVGDWEDWHTMPTDPSIRNPIYRIADRWFLRNADVIITCSQWLADQFAELRNRTVHYLPYAPVPKTWPSKENPFSTPTAVFMGSLRKHWDHAVLLQAMANLQKRGSKPKLSIIGSGEDLESCREYATKNHLDNIEFAGHLDDATMHNALCWAHTLVFPFANKPLNLARCPLKVFHYASAKRPIITSPYGEVKEFLGDQAIYSDCTPEGYAHSIEAIMSGERLPDIAYAVSDQTWIQRANTLQSILRSYL
ncbi:MAG: glycosyltransferase family 4 protein [Pirellulaceae bacterium]|nr:glycosyltransferase family 4 protein [Pirellulaceae bacterium]